MGLTAKCVLALACLGTMGAICYVGFVVGLHNGIDSNPFPVVIPHDRIAGPHGVKIGPTRSFTAPAT